VTYDCFSLQVILPVSRDKVHIEEKSIKSNTETVWEVVIELIPTEPLPWVSL
jgi:hypothetical protein